MQVIVPSIAPSWFQVRGWNESHFRGMEQGWHLGAPHAAGDHLAQLQGTTGQTAPALAQADHQPAPLEAAGVSHSQGISWANRDSTWEPHMRRVTILHSCRARCVRLLQPRRRQISNRQRMSRPALCVTYTMSEDSARPSSFSWLM